MTPRALPTAHHWSCAASCLEAAGLARSAVANDPGAPANLFVLSGRIAQRESARFTRGRSLVRSQVRPLRKAPLGRGFSVSAFGSVARKRPSW
jgi:hypothetical protein